jgi:protein HOOK3
LTATVAKQQSKIGTLTEKIDKFSQEKNEMLKLKDMVQDYGFIADKLQKTEALVEKYKKKSEESNEHKRFIEVLEEQLEESHKKSSAMEEEFRKVAGLKSLIDTYKSQISSLEERNAVLHVENVNLSFQLKDLKTHYRRVEAEKERDLEMIQDLQDQIKDMEFNAASTIQTDLEYRVLM